MSDFVLEMKKILSEYASEVQDTVREVVKDVAEESAEKLRDKDRGGRWKEYPKSWKSRDSSTALKAESMVYNDKNYRLTHLLEKGHDVSNQYGETGKSAKAYPHIAEVEDWAYKEVDGRVEDKLKELGK